MTMTHLSERFRSRTSRGGLHGVDRTSRPSSYQGLLCGLVVASGLFAVAVAYWVGRYSAGWKQPLYLAGELLIFMPAAAWLMFSKSITRYQRITIVLLVVVAQTAVKFLYSPLQLEFGDELMHWRTATDVLQTGHLFTRNFALPISSDYPGLENVTSAVSSLTGLSVFAAGVTVVAVVRILLALVLYLLFERASGRAGIASIGVLLYATNPHFQFFDSMFLYETIALPLAILVLAIIARKWDGSWWSLTSWWVLSVAAVFAVVVSHHLTSWMLTAMLALWAVFAALERGRLRDARPLLLTIIAGLFIAAWIWQVARDLPTYVAPTFEDLATAFTDPLAHGLHVSDTGGPPQPQAERVVIMISVVVLLTGIVVGVGTLRRQFRQVTVAWALTLASLSYLVAVLVRLVVPGGAELGGRLLAFVYVPVAFTLAAVMGQRWWRRIGRWRAPALIAIPTLLFVAGIFSGWPPHWERLPDGPYRPGAFEQSIEPQGVEAGRWAGQWLRPRLPINQRIAADFFNGGLMSSYGGLNVALDVAPLYYAPDLGLKQRELLHDAAIRYVVLDYRFVRQPPVLGFYFRDEDKSIHDRPLTTAELAKFESTPRSNVVFDSGDLVIVDLEEAVNAP